MCHSSIRNAFADDKKTTIIRVAKALTEAICLIKNRLLFESPHFHTIIHQTHVHYQPF